MNQIDVTADENNLEDVVGAWQRALAQKGLTAGRFYSIYNEDVAVPIVDEAVRERFERKVWTTSQESSFIILLRKKQTANRISQSKLNYLPWARDAGGDF